MTFLFATLDPATALFLFAASFVGSFITVAMGLGGGALLLAVMASLVPPAALIPVHGVIQLGSNLGRSVVMLPHTHWPPFASFAVGSIVGVIFGGLIAIDLPAHLVQIGVGVFIIWSVLQKPPAWLTRWPAITGVISSFLTMFFGATGPFVAAFMKSLSLDRKGHVATHGVLMTLQHFLKIIVFGILGFSFGPWLGFMAVMIGIGFCGTLVGRRVLLKMDDALFHKLLTGILLILAARLIWQGVLAV